MKRLLGGGNRLLLFRSYLYLVAGLLIVATVLDFGFGYLQSTQETDTDRWLEATFHFIERELAEVPADRRDETATYLSGEIGVDVQLLERDDVFMNSVSEHRLPALVDAAGNTSYLHDAESIDAIIRLGPVIAEQQSWLLDLLPPLFYLSIFVVAGLWLRPLLTDINRIAGAAQRFAADYREPLSTAGDTTQLTGLARNLDDMSVRLSGLIQNQKELIAALSHEMRTPLARIRFALAVLADKANDELTERLDALNADVQEIDDLIAAMLNYARLDHPDLQMHWQHVPLEPWLEQAVDKYRRADLAIEVERDIVGIDPSKARKDDTRDGQDEQRPQNGRREREPPRLDQRERETGEHRGGGCTKRHAIQGELEANAARPASDGGFDGARGLGRRSRD